MLNIVCSYGQQTSTNIYNFGFEGKVNEKLLPEKWYSTNNKDYSIILDTVIKHSGKASILISSDKDNANFESFMTIIPATMTGRNITVKAFMKLEDVEGVIGLMIRIDKKTEILQFDNMMQKKIKGTKDWMEYTVSLPLPIEADRITIGILLLGKGKVWADDISLWVDNSLQSYNLGFEGMINENGLPEKWMCTTNKDYSITLDTVIKHSGKASVLIYSSNRNASFETLMTTIPANITGKNITLKAFMKLEKVKDVIGLMLRIDGETEMLQFDNMMQKKIKGTKDWMEYAVTLPLPTDAKQIVIGIILSGKGSVWVDDISLLIDNEDFAKAKTKEVKIYKADTDTIEFKESSKIDIAVVNAQQIENLDKLGRIWGMMKYYHPSIARGEYNWDYELFRIMSDVLKAKTRDDCNNVLLKWVRLFGNLPQNNNAKVVKKNVKMEADLVWTDNDTIMGRELVVFLDSLENVIKEEEHYYMQFAANIGNPIHKNENSYSAMSYPDAGYRLLSLFRYWNAIQYYFPYKYAIGEDWNVILKEFIPKFIETKSEIDYRLRILELITRIHDSHAIMSNLRMDTYWGAYYSPYNISCIENKPIVTGYIDFNLARQSKLQIGDIILKINGKSTQEIFSELKSITPASNERTLTRDILGYRLLQSRDSIVSVDFERNGKIINETVKTYPIQVLYDSIYKDSPSYHFISPDISYLNLKTLKPDSVAFIIDLFKNTKWLIIDLREYPLYTPIFTLIRYLLSEPTETVRFSKTSFQKPGDFHCTQSLTFGEKNKKYYKGKIIVLIAETTQSHAEYSTMMLQTIPKTITIGSKTAGADGNISYLNLPGGIRAVYSGIGIYYPDGRETQRVGIIPDIEVKPTIQGIREGRDEILEKAIEVISRE